MLLRTLETRTFNARYSAVYPVRQNLICRSVTHHSLWRHWRCIDSLNVYRYTRVQAVGNTHARDARRIFNYSIRDIYISFTAAYAFFLPPPLPVERPSLLQFLGRTSPNLSRTFGVLTRSEFWDLGGLTASPSVILRGPLVLILPDIGPDSWRNRLYANIHFLVLRNNAICIVSISYIDDKIRNAIFFTWSTRREFEGYKFDANRLRNLFLFCFIHIYSFMSESSGFIG